MTVPATPPPISPAIKGAEIVHLRRQLRLSIEQLGAALGFQAHFVQHGAATEMKVPGARRIRRWEEGSEQPTGSALAALRYLRAIDRAIGFFEDGEPHRGVEVLRAVLPDFMQ